MARKKKPSRKYKPRNEFRYNFSPSSAGHPDYIFGYKDGKYKSFGLTHNPKKEHKSSRLNVNPDPSDKRDSYIQHKVKTTQERYFSDKLTGWRFDVTDWPLIRHLTKRHKKRQNKKR